MCGINAAEAQGCECMFTFCHAYPKMGVLLHKMAIVCNLTLFAVYTTFESPENQSFSTNHAQSSQKNSSCNGGTAKSVRLHTIAIL